MTAALTVPAVDMQAILDGRQWLYLAPQTVEHSYGCKGGCGLPGVHVHVEERSVSVVPPAPVTCPECGGNDGYRASCPGPYDGCYGLHMGHPCPTCDGSGTVPSPLLLCAEQERVKHDGSWDGWRDYGDPDPEWVDMTAKLARNGFYERRTAGLVLVPQPTYLPVVHVLDDDADPSLPYSLSWSNLPDGKPSLTVIENHTCTAVFDSGIDPDQYPADIVKPGGLLVMWDRADILDPPIVEMACLCPSIREGSLRGFTGRMVRRPDLCSACPPETPGRVPLSVGTGFTEVTLDA